MKKQFSLGLSLLGVTILLAACGQSAKAATNQRTLNVAVSTEASSLDPAHAVDATSGGILQQIMTPLYDHDQSGKIVPAMATKVVKPTNNGKTYTLTLRRDVKWSDGTPVTAKDFVYSLKRIVDPKTKTEFAYQYDAIANYQDIVAGKKSPDTLGVSAPSKYVLKIQLSQPTPYFSSQMTGYYPTNEAAVKRYGKNFGTAADKIVTNGAYKIKHFNTTSDSWDYVKDSNFYAAKSVKINHVHVNVLKDSSTVDNLFATGKLDDAPLSGNLIQKEADNPALSKTPAANMNYLQLNTKNPQLNNVNLRRAISAALDRQALTSKVLQDGSQPAKAFAPKGLATNPTTGKDFTSDAKTPLTYSPTKAKAYLKTALKELHTNSISFTILTSDVGTDKQVGEYLQSQLTKVLPQLKVTVNSLPKMTRIQRSLNGKFDAVLMSWNSTIQDPSDYLNTATADNISNFSKFSDHEYTTLMNKVNDTNGQSATARYQQELAANARVIDVAGYIPVYQSANSRLINTKVGGLHYSMLQPAEYRYAYFK